MCNDLKMKFIWWITREISFPKLTHYFNETDDEMNTFLCCDIISGAFYACLMSFVGFLYNFIQFHEFVYMYTRFAFANLCEFQQALSNWRAIGWHDAFYDIEHRLTNQLICQPTRIHVSEICCVISMLGLLVRVKSFK